MLICGKFLDKNSFKIQTERFILRTLKPEDVTQRYCAWFADPETKRHIQSAVKPHAIKDLRKYVQEKLHDENAIMLGIFDKTSLQHIGNIKYEPFNASQHWAVMGILIGEPDFRGQGVGKEVIQESARSLLQYGIFDIFLGVDQDNSIAVRAYRKIGFKKTQLAPFAIQPKTLAMIWRLK